MSTALYSWVTSMGTAFISFHREPREEQSYRLEKNITVEIGKAVFRSIVEEMELEKPSDPNWKGHLDGAYGIKYLYVGKDIGGNPYDFGPPFYRALRRLEKKGPPDFYPKADLKLFYDQINELEKMCSDLQIT